MPSTEDMVFVTAQELHRIDGDYPTGVDEQDAWRDEVAQAIAAEGTNGFQYRVDISAGNVECGYLQDVAGTWIVRSAEDGWDDSVQDDLPAGVVRCTYCFYASWG